MRLHVCGIIPLVYKTFEYKLRVNRQFINRAEEVLHQARFLWNCALEQRISYYRQTGKSLGYYEQSKQLTDARQTITELQLVNRNTLEDVLRRLDVSYKAFFQRLRAGGKAGFPRFKGADRFRTLSQQIEHGRTGILKGDRLTVPGVGTCRVHLSRPIEGRIKQLKLTRRASGWYALLVCDIPQPEPLASTGAEIGVDVGISDFAVLSSGEVVENPRHTAAVASKLAKAQRSMARKCKGSQSRAKARQKVARLHERVTSSRKDFHHKTAKMLVDNYDRIIVEDLNIKGMARNHSLAKSIHDVAWGAFFNITKVKAENAGRWFERIPAQYTSQTCSACGHRQKMPLKVRVFDCEICHIQIQRDHNAAINILGRGAASVEGDGTRRSTTRLST